MKKLSAKMNILFVALAVIAAAFALTGCAEVSVYDYTSDGMRYNVYELEIDADTVSLMERNAAVDANGHKYTVDGYFRELFSRLGYEVVSASAFGGAYTASFRKAFYAGQPTELDEAGTKPTFVAEYTDNPFVRDVMLTADNPFNGVRAAYDAVQPYRTSTAIERIKNGFGAFDERGEWVTEFPAITDAFPYLKGLDPDGLLLKYMMAGSSRMQSSGTSVPLDSDSSRYTFERYFDDADTNIYFAYKRPVSYGWYIVALVAGGLTLGALALVVRGKRRAKPTADGDKALDAAEGDATSDTRIR